jgi:hypothetical protein
MAFKKASVAESNVAEPKIVTHRPTTPVCYGDNWAQQFESILHDAGATPLAKCQPKIPQVRVLYDGPHEPGECHLMRVFLQITRPTKDPLIVPDVIDRANQGKELCWDKRDTEEQRDLKVAKYLVDLREVNRTLLRDRMREVLQKL